jgi:hypothetical protein
VAPAELCGESPVPARWSAARFSATASLRSFETIALASLLASAAPLAELLATLLTTLPMCVDCEHPKLDHHSPHDRFVELRHDKHYF